MAIRFVNTSEPNRPPTGRNWLYLDEADQILKLKKDDGTIVFLDGNGNGISSKIITEYITLDESNILNKTITLSNEPFESSGFVFIPSGGPAQIQNVDFTVSGSTVTWANLGLDGYLYADDKVVLTYTAKDSGTFLFQENIVLSEQNIIEKHVVLAAQPTDVNSVMLHPVGGPIQILNLDYQIINNLLTWDGLGLDGILASNDQLLVYYQRG